MIGRIRRALRLDRRRVHISPLAATMLARYRAEREQHVTALERVDLQAATYLAGLCSALGVDPADIESIDDAERVINLRPSG